MSYEVVYYCYGNASPVDLNHNPIPSICSVRAFNKEVPITVLHCESNEILFQSYQEKLNFKLARFVARTDNLITQMVYRPNDIYEHLMKGDHSDILYCDTDVVWHKNPDEFYKYCLENRGQHHCCFCQNLNAGLMLLSREVDVKLMESWYAIGHLLRLYDNSEPVVALNKAHYSTNNVHDESAFCILKALLQGGIPDVYFYEPKLSCCPIHEQDIPSAYNVHWVLGNLKQFIAHRYGVASVDKCGRVGVLMSIKQYIEYVRSQLGDDLYNKFVQNIVTLPVRQHIWEFCQEWHEHEKTKR